MFPLRATLTLMTSPHRPAFMVLGSDGHPSTSRYGLGSSAGLGYWVCWANAATPNPATTKAAAKAVNPTRLARDIPWVPFDTEFPISASRRTVHLHVAASQ